MALFDTDKLRIDVSEELGGFLAMSALLSAYGTPEVSDLYSQFITAMGQHPSAERRSGRSTPSTAEAERAHGGVKKAHDALIDQIRAELQNP